MARVVDSPYGRLAFGAALGLVGAVGLFVIDAAAHPNTAIVAFSLFGILTGLAILRSSVLCGVFYGVLFLYTVFSQIAYVNFPEGALALAAVQYYGPEAFAPYWRFVFASFICIAALHAVLGSTLRSPLPITLRPMNAVKTRTRMVFFGAVLAHLLLLLVFFVLRYNELSYSTREVLVGHRIFSLAFSLLPATMLTLYASGLARRAEGLSSGAEKWVLIGCVVLLLGIAIRSGQRTVLVSTVVGFGVYVLLTTGRNPWRQFSTVVLYGVLATAALVLANVIRISRGAAVSPVAFAQQMLSDPQQSLAGLFVLRELIFQDYFEPSLTLMTSQQLDLVMPTVVVQSAIANMLVYPLYPGLGVVISQAIDGNPLAGHGYYLLTEGYNAAGWWGIAYNAAIFNAGVIGWTWLSQIGDRGSRGFMTAVMATQVFGIVRGQSSYMIKGIYLIVIPAFILYCLAMHLRLIRTSKRPEPQL